MAQSSDFKFYNYLHPRHWITWLLLGILRLIVMLPYSLIMKIGAAFGMVMYRLMKCRRHIVSRNIELSFPNLSIEQRQSIIIEHFKNGGRSMLESAISWWWPSEKLNGLYTIHGLEQLKQAASEDKGVILLSAHFTSYELGGRMLSDKHPFQFLYKPQKKNPLYEAYTKAKRMQYYLDGVAHRDLRGMIKGLKKKRTCWYLPDQDFDRFGAEFVPFMGVETATITATSRLAKVNGSPVVPYFPIRRDDMSGYDIYILPVMEGFPSGDDREDCIRINQTIETFVHKAPAQYLWLHRRFKTRPEGEASLYEC